MDNDKDTHKKYLKRTFRYQCEKDSLSADTVAILDKYGSWMKALTDGAILPYTQAQESFVNFHNMPTKNNHSSYEAAWLEYRLECLYEQLKELEKNLGITVPYFFIQECYEKLAAIGHSEAHHWINKEKRTEKAFVTPLENLNDIVLPNNSFGRQAIGSGNYSTADKTNEDSADDWSTNIEDMDSGGWEKYLGGPDE